MRTPRFLMLALALSPALAVASRPAPTKPSKLGQCVACHGVEGRARAGGIPHLAGQDEQYLVSALLAYRGGQRRHPVMNSIANTLQPRDIQALAHWYATRAPGGPR